MVLRAPNFKLHPYGGVAFVTMDILNDLEDFIEIGYCLMAYIPLDYILKTSLSHLFTYECINEMLMKRRCRC